MHINQLSIFFFTLLLSITYSCKTEKSDSAPPNIVYILADDLGYGDIYALNSESKIMTPFLDNFASEAIRFTDAHSNSSVCTPTRYGILTGQYCWRSRIKRGVLLGYSPSLIEDTTPTIAKFLKDRGYNTACIGKWHLGIDMPLKAGGYHQGQPGVEFSGELRGFKDHEAIDFSKEALGGPKGAGFDYSYVLPASLDFQPYMYFENNLAVEAPTAWTEGNDLNTGYTGAFWRPGQMAPSFNFEEVLPTFTQKAVDFIDKQKENDKPFFLYFPLNAPHTPWVPTEEFRGKSSADQYGDFVQMVDSEVGKILNSLKENGMEKNTIVVFTSDNGAYWKPEFIERFNHRSNYTFRGMKSDAWEGGHHIPFMIRWPEKIKAGSSSDQTISLTDFFDTIRELLKAPEEEKPIDSFSLLPIITGETASNNRPPVIHHSGQGKFAIRSGDWKYIEGLGSGGFSSPANPDPVPGGPTGQLYNLKVDPAEKNNLFLSNPDIVKELEKELKAIRGY